MLPINKVRTQLAQSQSESRPTEGGSMGKWHAYLALLEFLTILLVLPIDQVNLLVGGPAGLALIVTLFDSFKGGPSQNGKNNRNLN